MREIESTDPERRPDHGVAGDCAASMCLPYQCRRRGQAGCHAVSQSVSVSRSWLAARLRRIKLHSVVAFDISTVKLFYLCVGFYDP